MSNQQKTFIVKIGTEALIDKKGSPDERLLADLMAQIALEKKNGHNIILVTSGAVGTGRARVQQNDLWKIRGCDEVVAKQIAAAIGQPGLMKHYVDMLHRDDMLAAQLLLAKHDFFDPEYRQNIENLFQGLRKQPNIVPVVNENDSVAVKELMFTDNDELACLLAKMVKADRVIILSNVDGVYDRDPRTKGATLIPRIDWSDGNGPVIDTEGASANGRGGMLNKLGVSRELAEAGIQTHIASSRTPKIIARILADEAIGTTIYALAPRPGTAAVASVVEAAPAQSAMPWAVPAPL